MKASKRRWTSIMPATRDEDPKISPEKMVSNTENPPTIPSISSDEDKHSTNDESLTNDWKNSDQETVRENVGLDKSAKDGQSLSILWSSDNASFHDCLNSTPIPDAIDRSDSSPASSRPLWDSPVTIAEESPKNNQENAERPNGSVVKRLEALVKAQKSATSFFEKKLLADEKKLLAEEEIWFRIADENIEPEYSEDLGTARKRRAGIQAESTRNYEQLSLDLLISVVEAHKDALNDQKIVLGHQTNAINRLAAALEQQTKMLISDSVSENDK